MSDEEDFQTLEDYMAEKVRKEFEDQGDGKRRRQRTEGESPDDGSGQDQSGEDVIDHNVQMGAGTSSCSGSGLVPQLCNAMMGDGQ